MGETLQFAMFLTLETSLRNMLNANRNSYGKQLLERVGVTATPETVKKLVGAGHRVVIEKDAGAKAAYLNDAYTRRSARQSLKMLIKAVRLF